MSDQIICIADEARRRYALAGLTEGRLRRLGGTPAFAAAVERELAELTKTAPRVRVESVGAEIAVDFRPVKTDDPRYLEAAADFFRGLGYSVRLLTEPQARIWLALNYLPIDEGLRRAWLPVLGAIPDDEAREMLTELDAAGKELADAARQAAKSGAGIKGRAAEFKKEIEDKFREALENK